jgi:hypothetical protein
MYGFALRMRHCLVCLYRRMGWGVCCMLSASGMAGVCCNLVPKTMHGWSLCVMSWHSVSSAGGRESWSMLLHACSCTQCRVAPCIWCDKLCVMCDERLCKVRGPSVLLAAGLYGFVRGGVVHWSGYVVCFHVRVATGE